MRCASWADLAVLAIVLIASAGPASAVTVFHDDFDGYGDGSFAAPDTITDPAFFEGAWTFSPQVFWSYDLLGDGSVNFLNGNHSSAMSTTAVFDPGQYTVTATVFNTTSESRSYHIGLGNLVLSEFLPAGTDKITVSGEATVTTAGTLSFSNPYPFHRGAHLTEITVTPVPEPASAALTTLAIAALVTARRACRS